MPQSPWSVVQDDRNPQGADMSFLPKQSRAISVGGNWVGPGGFYDPNGTFHGRNTPMFDSRGNFIGNQPQAATAQGMQMPGRRIPPWLMPGPLPPIFQPPSSPGPAGGYNLTGKPPMAGGNPAIGGGLAPQPAAMANIPLAQLIAMAHGR